MLPLAGKACNHTAVEKASICRDREKYFLLPAKTAKLRKLVQNPSLGLLRKCLRKNWKFEFRSVRPCERQSEMLFFFLSRLRTHSPIKVETTIMMTPKRAKGAQAFSGYKSCLHVCTYKKEGPRINKNTLYEKFSSFFCHSSLP